MHAQALGEHPGVHARAARGRARPAWWLRPPEERVTPDLPHLPSLSDCCPAHLLHPARCCLGDTAIHWLRMFVWGFDCSVRRLRALATFPSFSVSLPAILPVPPSVVMAGLAPPRRSQVEQGMAGWAGKLHFGRQGRGGGSLGKPPPVRPTHRSAAPAAWSGSAAWPAAGAGGGGRHWGMAAPAPPLFMHVLARRMPIVSTSQPGRPATVTACGLAPPSQPSRARAGRLRLPATRCWQSGDWAVDLDLQPLRSA